jgi:hypothetical protein
MCRWGLGLGITVLALAAMVLAICWLFSSTDVTWLCEQIMGETPEAKATAYVRAVARGDENAALNLWELPGLQDQEQLQALAERREQVTSQLIAARIEAEVTILDTEWWTTCCEPVVTCDPHSAGGARMTVQSLDNTGSPIIYVLDIFVRDGPYWGAAAGYPFRHWALRDVYLEGEEPLYWRRLHEETIRYLDWVHGRSP